MEEYICSKLKKLTPYNPVENVCNIRLDANESCIELTEKSKTKIAEKVSKISFNRYPDPFARDVCGLFGRHYGIPPRLVTAGNGSDELITILFGMFTEEGDKVLILQPDFSMYSVYCDAFGRGKVLLKKDQQLQFRVRDVIEKASAENVRMVIFSNPCNPTGQGITREEVLELVNGCHCLVVVDEAYMDFWDQSVLNEASAAENLVVLKTCSKIGFAAGRLGFAVANSEITDYLRSAKSPYNVNALTQAAGAVFLEDGEFLDNIAEAVKRSRDRLCAGLTEIGRTYADLITVYESHTNFVLVQSEAAEQIHRALIQMGISVRLFKSGFLRITAGLEAENRAFLSAFRQILDAIRSGRGIYENS